MLVRQVLVRNPVGTSAYRRRSATVTAQVLIWRIFFVTAVLAMPVAVIAFDEPRHTDHEQQALKLVKQYAFEAFPQWAVSLPSQECPRSIHDLGEFSYREPVDPWGTPLAFKCGAPIRGVFVYSAGPDRELDTADDITSNTEY